MSRLALEWTFYLQAVQSYASFKYEWISARNREKMCKKGIQNRVLWRIDLLVSNGIGHFKGCGIEAHQNGVLFRMLTYCVVQRHADLPLQPLKNLRCSLPLFKRTVPISPW